MSVSLEATIAGVLDVDPAELSDARFERFASWDSQRQIELALALERAYGVEFDDREIDGLDSVAAVRALLLKHGRPIA